MNHASCWLQSKQSCPRFATLLLKKQNQKYSISIRAEDTQPGLTDESAHLALVKGRSSSKQRPQSRYIQNEYGPKLSCDPHAKFGRFSRWSTVSMLIQALRGSRGWNSLCVGPLPWRRGQRSARLSVFFGGRAERIAVRWMVMEGETMQALACDRAQLLHSGSLNRRIAGGGRGECERKIERRKWKLHEETSAGRPAFLVTSWFWMLVST